MMKLDTLALVVVVLCTLLQLSSGIKTKGDDHDELLQIHEDAPPNYKQLFEEPIPPYHPPSRRPFGDPNHPDCFTILPIGQIRSCFARNTPASTDFPSSTNLMLSILGRPPITSTKQQCLYQSLRRQGLANEEKPALTFEQLSQYLRSTLPANLEFSLNLQEPAKGPFINVVAVGACLLPLENGKVKHLIAILNPFGILYPSPDVLQLMQRLGASPPHVNLPVSMRNYHSPLSFDSLVWLEYPASGSTTSSKTFTFSLPVRKGETVRSARLTKLTLLDPSVLRGREGARPVCLNALLERKGALFERDEIDEEVQGRGNVPNELLENGNEFPFDPLNDESLPYTRELGSVVHRDRFILRENDDRNQEGQVGEETKGGDGYDQASVRRRQELQASLEMGHYMGLDPPGMCKKYSEVELRASGAKVSALEIDRDFEMTDNFWEEVWREVRQSISSVSDMFMGGENEPDAGNVNNVVDEVLLTNDE